MAATFLSLHVVWAEQTAFAAQLVRNLVKDMAAVAVGPGQATIAQLRRFLALCNCIAAFAKACGSSLAADIAGAWHASKFTFFAFMQSSNAIRNSCNMHSLHLMRVSSLSDPDI